MGLFTDTKNITVIQYGPRTYSRSGYEEIKENMTKTSEWIYFIFYYLVWCIDFSNKPNVDDDAQKLEKWLGFSHRVGSDLCYWLMT